MISVKGPKDVSAATVTVDGESVPAALLDADRPTDPGDHVIEASAPGYLKASARVSVKEAERKAVSVRLDPDPNAVVAPPPGPVEPPTGAQHFTAAGAAASRPRNALCRRGPTPDPRATAPNRTGAYVAWALGGVALAVGAGFRRRGHERQGTTSKRKCPAGVCPPTESDTLPSAKTAGNIATAGFIVGGVGARARNRALFYGEREPEWRERRGRQAAGAPPRLAPPGSLHSSRALSSASGGSVWRAASETKCDATRASLARGALRLARAGIDVRRV